MDSAEHWATRHFGDVDLRDKRLNRRVIKVAQMMAANPSASIPDQYARWADTKAAYRLFADPQASFESLAQGHWQQTRAAARSCPEVLFIQDTTWLNYGHHPGTKGLGRHGSGKCKNDQGMHLHSVLAVQPLGEQSRILGLAYGQLWVRPPELFNADQASRSVRRKAADRESLRWSEAVRQVGSASSGSRFLHVGDREADLFDLYEQTTKLDGVGFVIRGNHDRSAALGHDTPESMDRELIKGSRLKRLMRSIKPALSMSLRIAANNGRKARTAELKISYTAVTLYSPQVRGRQQKALRCWCVRVFEPHPPVGTEPTEWILLTSQPVRSIEDAQRIVRYYHWRWLIEEYHRCLKSGCRVEESQLKSMKKLSALIGMSSVVATRLLQLKNDARIHPQAPAIEHAPLEMVRMLCHLTGRRAETMTLREFIHGVAKRGGFLGRRRDGEPGWKTLWRGWQKLTLLCEGYRIAKSTRDVGKG